MEFNVDCQFDASLILNLKKIINKYCLMSRRKELSRTQNGLSSIYILNLLIKI